MEAAYSEAPKCWQDPQRLLLISHYEHPAGIHKTEFLPIPELWCERLGEGFGASHGVADIDFSLA